MKNNFFFQSLVYFIGLLFSLETFATEKPHVHGAAQLNLALESPLKGEVNFDIPADSVWGFEHLAKTPKDKEAVSKGLNTLREGASQIIRFPVELKCVTSSANAEIEKEEHPGSGEHAHHQDVSGGYKFECASSVDGAKVTIGLFKLLPKLKKVSFQVLENTKQAKKELSSDTQEIKL